MVFNATFNYISAILWRSVSLVEESGVPGENQRPVASHRQTLSHNVVSYLVHLAMRERTRTTHIATIIRGWDHVINKFDLLLFP